MSNINNTSRQELLKKTISAKEAFENNKINSNYILRLLIGDALGDFTTLTIKNNSKLNLDEILKNKKVTGIHIDSYVGNLESLLSKFKDLKLQELSITNSNINEIPETIKFFSDLRILDLSKNKIKEIKSSDLEKFQELESLNLSGNKITNFDTSNTNNIVDLDLSNNTTFYRIPNCFADKFPKLRKLKLNGCNIKMLENIFNLKQIEILDLSYNNINHITI